MKLEVRSRGSGWTGTTFCSQGACRPVEEAERHCNERRAQCQSGTRSLKGAGREAGFPERRLWTPPLESPPTVYSPKGKWTGQGPLAGISRCPVGSIQGAHIEHADHFTRINSSNPCNDSVVARRPCHLFQVRSLKGKDSRPRQLLAKADALIPLARA